MIRHDECPIWRSRSGALHVYLDVVRHMNPFLLSRSASLARQTRHTYRSFRTMNTDSKGNLALYTSSSANGRPGWVEHFESQLKDHPAAKCLCLAPHVILS
jgi:hypothetical protein